ncbi:MAG: zinc-dependent alcohol dehydrogenase family protein [Anaerolineales bacterium]|nr:zinc-dependent alcohol dehydrogenase family protein [Anaerolineales bacterium]
MKAMTLHRIIDLSQEVRPLRLEHLPDPEPAEGELLVKVSACGVCHTELDEIEGRTPPTFFPIVLGHQVVGRVVRVGGGVRAFQPGDRVGVAWIYSACGKCAYCLEGRENLCASFKATGRDAHGGYAELMCVPASFAHPIPEAFSDAEAAPLLCAGAIGYRSLVLANLKDGEPLGLTGFGASAHLVLKLAQSLYPRSPVYAFSRSEGERAFARKLGAAWAGGIGETPPQPLEAIIDTTPAWRPVLEGLRSLAPGGRLVINAIRKEDADKDALLSLDYPAHLWLEKEVKSVANVTREDVRQFLELAARLAIRAEQQEFPLEDANQALLELKNRKIRGAKVLRLA